MKLTNHHDVRTMFFVFGQHSTRGPIELDASLVRSTEHRSHRRGEEEHKINNKKVKEVLLLRKTIVTIEFQEQKKNCCDS